jgi:hypothetical protein
MKMSEGEEGKRKRFYPCFAWKKIQPVFFDASLGFMDLMSCHLVFISYAFSGFFGSVSCSLWANKNVGVWE